MTLEELKAQRAEIDRQIRGIENNVVKTDNFVVQWESKKRLALKFKLSDSKYARAIMNFTEFCFPGKDGPLKELIAQCDSLINQLEYIKDKLNSVCG